MVRFFLLLLLVSCVCSWKKTENSTRLGRKLKPRSYASRLRIDGVKLEQGRVNNALIFGIAETKKENVVKIVQDIGYKLGIESPLNDIESAYRYKSSKVPQPILVRFKNNGAKGKWVILYRRSKLWNQEVYLQEHLSSTTMQLVVETRKWAKEKQYPHVWTWNNEVFYRKRDNALRLKVINMGHLHRLKTDEKAAETLDILAKNQ
uniref:FP protein C-terminal domain-containing protein n=1 Tax=Cacopsylla melanoneura TaxID=428564 RepID=A0A8D8VPW0_9HEMI